MRQEILAKNEKLAKVKIISVTEVVRKTAILGGIAIEANDAQIKGIHTFEVDQEGSLRLKEAWRNDRANKWLRTRTSVLKTSSENFPVNMN